MSTSEKTLAWCLALSITTNAIVLCVAMRYASSTMNLIVNTVLT